MKPLLSRGIQLPRLLEVPLHQALPPLILLLPSLTWASGSSTQDFLGLGNLLSRGFACDFITARNGSSWTDYIGAVIRFMVGGYGTVAAHELTHRIKNRIAMLEEDRRSPSAVCSFSLEHVYGHHVTVGTDADPATAKKRKCVCIFHPVHR